MSSRATYKSYQQVQFRTTLPSFLRLMKLSLASSSSNRRKNPTYVLPSLADDALPTFERIENARYRSQGQAKKKST